jgi:toxin-antitoxin system PIN domain toxin
MTLSFLLDVNVLVALFDTAHVHHLPAHAWFSEQGVKGWRSCPITENGFLRVLSHPAYPNQATPIPDLAERLEEFKQTSPNYHFWSNDYSPSEWIASKQLPIASTQSTDAYLLHLCHRNQGTLATFDRRILPSLIRENTDSIIEYIQV